MTAQQVPQSAGGGGTRTATIDGLDVLARRAAASIASAAARLSGTTEGRLRDGSAPDSTPAVARHRPLLAE